MTGRDRLVVVAVVVLVALGAGWLLVVSPQRKQASKLQGEVNAANSKLASTEGQLASARTDKARYSAAYSSVIALGKAVPPGHEMPSLVYQLAQASDQKHVEFASIVNGSAGSPGAGPSSGPASAGSPGAGSPGAGSSSASSPATSASSTTPAGFTQMPFTFVFNGTFFDLYHLFQQLNRFTVRTASGDLQVSGRLLTIQSAKLAPAAASAEHTGRGQQVLSGTITATAYVLPPTQGLTGGATSATPTPAAAGGSSSATGAPSATAPAVVRVGP